MGISSIISIVTIFTIIVILIELGIIAYYIFVLKSKEKDYDSIDNIEEVKTSSQTKQETILRR